MNIKFYYNTSVYQYFVVLKNATNEDEEPVMFAGVRHSKQPYRTYNVPSVDLEVEVSDREQLTQLLYDFSCTGCLIYDQDDISRQYLESEKQGRGVTVLRSVTLRDRDINSFFNTRRS